MDSYEATKMVFSRIQTLDPGNASKIMGYLLIQDHGDKEMIRLALGTDTLLHSLILKAKTHLTVSSPKLQSTHINGFHEPPSYASVVNGSTQKPTIENSLSPSALPFYNSKCNGNLNSNDGFIDLENHLSFLNESKCEDSVFDQIPEPTLSQLQRSFSMHSHLHDLCYDQDGDANSGFGWKPCLYFARGFCKNGNSCRFFHEDEHNNGDVESPSNNEFLLEQHCKELLKAKAAASQQQKLAQFMAASGHGGSGASFPYNKYMNFLLQQQNDTHRSAAAAALMMGDDFQKFGRCRLEIMNPASRQIYLTFPADSTFSEEDVSNYFSIYGPVQDVRIPYQQKRMFGFVTFVYPDTVKLILGKGNPHFVCDSRVLVKPYKEKGKVAEKKLQLQLERGNYSACSSPTGLDSREPFDLHLGARMLYNKQEMLLRRNLELRADLQQAMELQGRRLMKLQVLDFNNPPNQYHHHTASPIPSPHTPNNHQNLMFQLDGIDRDLYEENKGGPVGAAICRPAASDSNKQEVNPSCNHNNSNQITSDKDKNVNFEESNLRKSLEHILPDNLFASPKKMGGDHLVTLFSEADALKPITSPAPAKQPSYPLVSSSETINMPSFKLCFLQMPRLSSGQIASYGEIDFAKVKFEEETQINIPTKKRKKSVYTRLPLSSSSWIQHTTYSQYNIIAHVKDR